MISGFEDPVFMGYDGSKFDSHQHWAFRNNIDNFVYNKT